jgi:hypothetical protein
MLSASYVHLFTTRFSGLGGQVQPGEPLLAEATEAAATCSRVEVEGGSGLFFAGRGGEFGLPVMRAILTPLRGGGTVVGLIHASDFVRFGD